jgi:CDP-glycerol glycerophosphotransferase (TagB/SpsB family)
MHIAFLLPHGFAARMVIRGGVAQRLILRGAHVTVISPNADEAYFQRECESEGIALQQEPGGTGRIALWFRLYRPYLLEDVFKNPAFRPDFARRFRHRPLAGLALTLLNRMAVRSPLVRRLCKAVEVRVNRAPAVKRLLQRVRPDLLVLPNPFGVEETVYLLHARELGIPVACEMLSWDNITTKGSPLLMPDYFISWGPIMTEEMVEVYRFPKERIYECGVPHFDIYHRGDQFIPRDALLRELHLPSERPYLFYGMVAERYCPNEIEILTWLAHQVNRDAFAAPCSLVIRPHPLTISGIYASASEDLARLRGLVGPRVALATPTVLSEKLAWDLPKSDMSHLASLLAGSAMCLNASSTLCLDACTLDRPVIDIAFDGRTDLPYERSARQCLDYIHMAKLLSLGGVRIARSFAELQAHIDAYLRDPNLEQAGRLLSATQECGPRDGRAAERVAISLLQLLR